MPQVSSRVQPAPFILLRGNESALYTVNVLPCRLDAINTLKIVRLIDSVEIYSSGLRLRDQGKGAWLSLTF